MGYAIMMGECGNCKRMFSYNPRFVPSKDNIPFCKECVEGANPIRVKNGLEPIRIHLEAYEPIDENLL